MFYHIKFRGAWVAAAASPGVALVGRWHVVGGSEGHCVCRAASPQALALWLQPHAASVAFAVVPVTCAAESAAEEDGDAPLFAVEYVLRAAAEEEALAACVCVGRWHNAVSGSGLMLVAAPRPLPCAATVVPVLSDAQHSALPPPVRRQWWS